MLMALVCQNAFAQNKKSNKEAPNKFENIDTTSSSNQKGTEDISEYGGTPIVTRTSKFIEISEEKSGEEIASLYDECVVIISGSSSTFSSQGSGVIISSDGYLITNYHVIAGMNNITASNAIIKNTPVTIIFKDQTNDIALCKLPKSNYKTAQFWFGDALFKGSTIYAIGSPLGTPNMITKGIVSGKYIEDGKAYIVHDAAMGSGSSGGALINAKGLLVGINTKVKLQQKETVVQNFNYAIPIHVIENILKEAGYENVLKNTSSK